MSLPEVIPGLKAFAAACAILAVAGCTVQPLHGSRTAVAGVSGAPISAELAAVEVRMPRGNDPRVGQEVRNHLIFMFGGGAGPASAPRYVLDLTVNSARSGAASIQRVTREQEPTAAVVTVTATYVLSEPGTGREIASGSRRATAAFDLPRQEFAALRAERNAQDRAAREASEFVRLAVAQELTAPRHDRSGRAVLSEGELENFSGELDGSLEEFQ